MKPLSPPRLRAAALTALMAIAVAVVLLFVLSKTPSKSPLKSLSKPSSPILSSPPNRNADFVLAGYDSGLYRVHRDGRTPNPVWTGGEVRKILPFERGAWFLASTGIFRYREGGEPADLSADLPTHTFKYFRGDEKSLERATRELKDAALDPESPDTLAVATSSEVFITVDGGAAWTSLGFPVLTSGTRALAFAPFPGTGENALWLSHPVKGVFAHPLVPGSNWEGFNAGLPPLSSTIVDEVSGFAVESGVLYASVTFAGTILRFDEKDLRFVPVLEDPRRFSALEAPSPAGSGSIRFADGSGIHILDASGLHPDEETENYVADCARALPDAQLQCLAWTESRGTFAISGLWALSEPRVDARAAARLKAASRRDGLYLRTDLLLSPDDRAARFDMMAAKNLDTLVVDVKDDAGKLRFQPLSPLLKEMGVIAAPLELEEFVGEARLRGFHLVARIVVFKDESLYRSSGGRLAVLDSVTGKPWRGYRATGATGSSPPERRAIGEYWVDPYSEEVWRYNVEIAKEMIQRGFDEIQFDYIRFPTDGDNLGEAFYSWADPGMDQESALLSFFAYARENINAPISVDIYGANGWYRTGLKTGQDVELFARYVDAICPMFYPSHFEQGFLAQDPAADRPYRIYRQGSIRNRHFARGRTVIRPWVQSFFLDVPYDRIWYDAEYVRKEVLGIRDSTADGMTFWNNSGRYDEIPADLSSYGDRVMLE